MSNQRREFMQLLDVHGGALLAMLRRLCRNRHDADDVMQETAIRVWRNFDRRPVLRSPRAWLMTIGYRAFLDCRKRHNNHELMVDVPDTPENGPDVLAERAERCDRLRDLLNELPPAVREVLVLHYSAHLTIRETAAAMGISTGTVKSRLNSALTKLRGKLQ